MFDEIFLGVADSGLRGRMVHEHGVIRAAVGGSLALDNARILDFGCGEGIAANSIALRYPDSQVFGMDIVPVDVGHLSRTFLDRTGLGVASNFEVWTGGVEALPGEFDLIYAWSVFEHVNFEDISSTLRTLGAHLSAEGMLFLQINPLFYSPRGAHLYNYIELPWCHLLLSHEELKSRVMSSKIGSETAKLQVWRQYCELNRATMEDILRAADQAGLSTVATEHFFSNLVPPARLQMIERQTLLTEEMRVLFRVT